MGTGATPRRDRAPPRARCDICAARTEVACDVKPIDGAKALAEAAHMTIHGQDRQNSNPSSQTGGENLHACGLFPARSLALVMHCIPTPTKICMQACDLASIHTCLHSYKFTHSCMDTSGHRYVRTQRLTSETRVCVFRKLQPASEITAAAAYLTI